MARPLLSPESIRPDNVRSILVIRSHNVTGDFLLATPVFEALKTRFPNARVGAMVREFFAEVVEHHPFVDEIVTVNKKKQWSPLEWRRLLRQIRGRWDLVVVLNTVSHSLTSDLLAHLTAAPFVAGPEYPLIRGARSNFFYNLVAPHSREEKHQTVRNLDIVAFLGAKSRNLSESMRLLDPELEEGRRRFRDLGVPHSAITVAMHPGAGKLRNRWPVARFAELASRLRNQNGANIVLFWGPREEELAEEFRKTVDFRIFEIPPSTMRRMAACFRQCDLLVCNDTGVMHLCAAAGVPLVGLFGPTDPELWKPIGDQFVAVRGKDQTMESLAVVDVYAAVTTRLDSAVNKRHSQENAS